MGESDTELCQHTQRERPCRGCQGLEREREGGEGGCEDQDLECEMEKEERNQNKTPLRLTFSSLPLDCFLCAEAPESEVHNEARAICLRSALTQYRFRPVGVIVVQLTEQTELVQER